MIIEAILITSGVILAVFGLGELLHTIRLAFICRKKEVKLLSVVFLRSGSAVAQLYFAAEQRNWLGGDFAEYVVAVIDDIDDDELAECREVASQKGFVLCKKSELLRISENLTFRI